MEEPKKEESVKTILKTAWIKIKVTINVFQREANETVIAAKILTKMLKGKEVSKEQIEFLKGQSVDLGKALALIGLQAIPGSSVAIIALEKVASKYGITLFPKDQSDPNMDV